MQEPTHEEIAIAAYFIWLNNSLYGIDEDGLAVANWYAAEEQLRQQSESAETTSADPAGNPQG
jgi:hypothetical protein